MSSFHSIRTCSFFSRTDYVMSRYPILSAASLFSFARHVTSWIDALFCNSKINKKLHTFFKKVFIIKNIFVGKKCTYDPCIKKYSSVVKKICEKWAKSQQESGRKETDMQADMHKIILMSHRYEYTVHWVDYDTEYNMDTFFSRKKCYRVVWCNA